MPPTALITGASQGSGKATALLFAQKGYDLVLAARQLDRLEAVAAQVEAMGQSALAVSADVGEAPQVENLVQQALERFGQIDVLINNAGICLTGSMLETTPADWQQIMNTNFWGYVQTIQALLPQFLQRHSGSIVNVGSLGGKMPLPQMTAYCASKYAVTGLTDTLRLELSSQGIHVGAVHPGLINSDFLERAQFRGADRQRLASALKAGWVSQPADIAQAIWEVVDQRRSEIVVGPAAIATEAYRLLPAPMQWLLSRAGS
ncbi:MAG: SDR family oxidoreductase [Pegethrix bostrychoides GSE-TBD4-15B]|jgi:NADP-dependent 3-hydroxy acid dehydrogenase YdfG|uniref:SDR family oxidoreductase n=1 Tax=Pegethrix bostrychoides GSE-TBD4-15B TaxID=2839662 RepID=A0A951U599_9CYAN|nr:SDR family oxidoreductase [Pegethrix bostrychoides GSE-TBD4-15B]